MQRRMCVLEHFLKVYLSCTIAHACIVILVLPICCYYHDNCYLPISPFNYYNKIRKIRKFYYSDMCIKIQIVKLKCLTAVCLGPICHLAQNINIHTLYNTIVQ